MSLIKQILWRLGVGKNNFHYKDGTLGRKHAVGRVIEDTDWKTFQSGDSVLVKLCKDYSFVDKKRMTLGEDGIFISGEWAIPDDEYCRFCFREKFTVENGQNYCPICEND